MEHRRAHENPLPAVPATVALAFLFAGCSRPPEDALKSLYGAFGYDSADKTTHAGDDFFRFANGMWLDRTQIPADKATISLRSLMANRTEARLHDLMEQAAAKSPHQPADLEGKMGAFYKSFIDEARVEQAGAKPIAPQLSEVSAAKSRDALAALMGRNNSDFEATLFNFGIYEPRRPFRLGHDPADQRRLQRLPARHRLFRQHSPGAGV
jgi:putative endopeptidase